MVIFHCYVSSPEGNPHMSWFQSPLNHWIGLLGKIFTGKPLFFHGKITLVSGEDFPQLTNPWTETNKTFRIGSQEMIPRMFFHMYFKILCTLWWTNILPWKDPPFLKGKSTISMDILIGNDLLWYRVLGSTLMTSNQPSLCPCLMVHMLWKHTNDGEIRILNHYFIIL